MVKPVFRAFDWISLVKAAEPKTDYYDEYRFSGRNYKKRDVLESPEHGVTAPPPAYDTKPK